MYVKQSNTADTINRAPVRLENGRLVVRECRPVLHFKKPTPRYTKTSVDRASELLHQLRLINITRGL
jgi:hypothetical protein